VVFHRENEHTVRELRDAAIGCGVCGTKFLQFLVMNDGVLSPSSKKGLYDVLEDCRVHDWDHTVRTYQTTFAHSIYDDFIIDETTQPVPIGSGSIGQVYKLYERSTRQYVATKVKHPGVEKNVADFIRTVRWIMSSVKWLGIYIPFQLIIEEFIRNVQLQLDYENEATNMRKMPRYDGIVIPDVLRVGSNVIVMTYHDGISFLDVKDKRLRLKAATNVFLFMISCLLCDNFIHCDMHYGNWKVRPESEEIVVYDCGIVASLGSDCVDSEQAQEDLKAFMMGVLDGNIDSVARVVCVDLDTDPCRDAVVTAIAELNARTFEKDTDRLEEFLRMLLRSGVRLDSDVLRCFQGLLICLSTFIVSKDGFMRYLGQDNYMDLFLCIFSGLLSRKGKFKGVQQQFDEWICDDPCINNRFTDWMQDMYGHTDREVLFDVLEELDII
jgi:predicted unusual protein kinase regulating ubiquinone biosynthesis (AarF/ABC1/UbiB family)